MRHNSPKYSNIPKEDTVIIINSLDEEYIKRAEAYCKREGIEYHITESNGTPAKGKNSLLDIFLASDNDYCVMVDGDDFLTQYGVAYYKSIENNKIVPDALCITNGISLHTINGKTVKVTLKASGHEASASELYERFMANGKNTHEQAVESADNLMALFDTQKKYSERGQPFTRVTWLSKKAAKFTFDEDLVIGEDAIQLLKLKHEAYTNDLKFYTLNEHPVTYIYDQRTWGTVREVSKDGTDFSWVHPYTNKLKIMELNNQLHPNKYLQEYRLLT
tara:strand:+ start:1906 stop:2733 length:828 start_codon:yes stop_codon:yes gene_type:complete